MDEFSEGCIEAMESTFSLCEAITENGLSVNDLVDVCSFAIKDGHDRDQLCLGIMSHAISLANEKTEGLPKCH